MNDNDKKLDNPLVVHNKNDASYYNSDEALQMEQTHEKIEAHHLERHRFKKESNPKTKKIVAFLVVLVVLAVVFCALYFTGNITFNKDTTTQPTETTSEVTTSIEQAYEGTIVVNDTYIFVDGTEVEGIQGLQQALRTVTPSTTAYKIINENANGMFLDNEVLPILYDLGFYDENTEILHKNQTGLVPSALATTESTEELSELTETVAQESTETE